MSTTTPNVQTHLGRVQVDSLQIGSSSNVIGGAWTQFTPVIGTGTFSADPLSIQVGRYTVIGKTAFLSLVLKRDDNSGAVSGAGSYTVKLPAGLVAKTVSTVASVGSGILTVAATTFIVTVSVTSTGNLTLLISSDTQAPVLWGSAQQPFATVAAMTLTAEATFELA